MIRYSGNGARAGWAVAAAVAVVALPLTLAAALPWATTSASGVLSEPQDTLQVRPNASLQVVERSSERRLAIFRNGSESGSIAVPPRVSASALAEGLKQAVWHPNRDDVAVGFKGSEKGVPAGDARYPIPPVQSFVVVFLLQPGGTYVAVDVSLVEYVNIGRIGPNRSYRDAATAPTEWLKWDGENVRVSLETAAWDLTGQRYRSREWLIITRDGRALWR